MTLSLIASESRSSEAVLAAGATVASGKTAEGYPGARYHTGMAVMDEPERLTIDRARSLFGAEHANVQPNSGVNANLAVYAALLRPGDPILAMDLAHGGHLSHGAPVSITGTMYRFRQGIGPDAMEMVGNLIDRIVRSPDDHKLSSTVNAEVASLCRAHPL